MEGLLCGIGEMARRLGVAVSTLRRWDREGRLKPTSRTPGGHRRYGTAPDAPETDATVLYARVSTQPTAWLTSSRMPSGWSPARATLAFRRILDAEPPGPLPEGLTLGDFSIVRRKAERWRRSVPWFLLDDWSKNLPRRVVRERRSATGRRPQNRCPRMPDCRMRRERAGWRRSCRKSSGRFTGRRLHHDWKSIDA